MADVPHDDTAAQTLTMLPALLGTRRWRLSHRDVPHPPSWLRLAEDGTVQEYSHPNERRWALHDGRLVLLHEDGRVSVAFDVVQSRDGELHLEGRHLLAENGPVLCLDSAEEAIVEAEPLPPGPMRDNSRHFIDHHGWRIGDYTYGSPEVVGAQWGRLEIGAYCSLANHVTIVLGQHNHHFVSTFPFMMLQQDWPGVPPGVHDHIVSDLVIGSDVWIATHVTVMGGITVGDGAILGANAVVTRDVPPYAIVAGVPARVIGYRFEPDIIARLLRLRWWDWPRARVNRMLPLMMQDDIAGFLDEAEQEDARATQAPAP